MKDPIKLENILIDRDEIAAVLRQEGRVIVFLKSGKTVNFPDTLSREELEALAGIR